MRIGRKSHRFHALLLTLVFLLFASAGLSAQDFLTIAEDTPGFLNVANSQVLAVGAYILLTFGQEAFNTYIALLNVPGFPAPPAHGSAAGLGGNLVLYVPNANYIGSDSFTYVLSSGILSTSGIVIVNVTSVPDLPTPPSDLLTDSLTNPNNVSHYVPVFSWTFSDVDQADASGDWQTAYQIQIGTAEGSSDVWDSGKVASLTSSGVYGGVELAPNVTCYWSVRVWDKYDLVGPYSSSGTFVILDIGLRLFDGTSTVRIAADYVSPSYPLRIYKNGTTYGIILVDPLDPSASKIRIQTSSGIKALKKM